MKEVGADYGGVGKRGSVIPDVKDFICGSCERSLVLWDRGVRYFTAHWEDLCQIPPQGGPQTDGASTTEGTGWYVGVTTAGGGKGGGRHT